MSNLLHLGIAILVACILFYIFTPDDKPTPTPTPEVVNTLKNELTYRTLVEGYESNIVDEYSEIPNESLGIYENDDVEKKRRKVFKYFSDYLDIYCNVKKEDLESKTKSFILKLYNFIKNKTESNGDFYEITKDMPVDGRNPYSGKPKGYKYKFAQQTPPPNIREIFNFIIFYSNFSDESKIDILASSSVIFENMSYDPVNNTVSVNNNTASYDELKKYLFNKSNETFSPIKLIDQDILNYNLCV